MPDQPDLKHKLIQSHLVLAIALLFIISVDLRPATIRGGKASPTAAQNFAIINCDIGCYTLGSHPLRIIIDNNGAIILVFFNSHALTAFSAIPAMLALGVYDHVSAGVIALAYIMSVAQARSSALKPEDPKTVIPKGAKCIIVGVNDFVETYVLRTNHTCGYINYVGDGANITERYFLKPKFFSETVERYGHKFDIIFLDRDAAANIGNAIYSVPDNRMAMGVLFEADRAIRSTNGTNKYKRQTRVVVTRLTNSTSEERGVMVEALKGWARFRPWMMPDRHFASGLDSSYALYNTTFLNMFAVSDKNALKRHCSRKYVNRGDCMRERLDSVVKLDWYALMDCCVFVVVLCLVHADLRSRRGYDSVGRRFLGVVALTCVIICVFLAEVISGDFDEWKAWYTDGKPSFQLQSVLLVAVATRISWRACESQLKRWVD